MSPDLESNTRALAGLPSPCVRATVKLLLDWKALSQGKSEQSVCGGGGQDRGWDRRQERRDQGAGGCEQGVSSSQVRVLHTILWGGSGMEQLGAGCCSNIKCPQCLNIVFPSTFWAPW